MTSSTHTLRRGFTLIELLVVIAIIGILSSIVLNSLSTARAKGADSKVKNQLSNLRSAAEIYFDTNGNYGVSSDCTTDMFADGNMVELVNPANYPAGVTLACNSDAVSWAVSANLTTSSSTFWCVDSTGNSKQVDSDPGAVTVCP